jgi:hypothetical protein
MLDENLRTLFTLEAEAEPPPSRLTLPSASRNSRLQRRHRRALAIATPVLAAAAVVGVAAGTTLLAPGASAPPGKTPAIAPAHPGSREFNAARVYAVFGWLPRGTKVVGGEAARALDFVDAHGPNDIRWSLSVYAPGQCQTRAARPRSSRTDLVCTNSAVLSFTGGGPAIHGHDSYWASGNLAWRYSANGWATLAYCSAFCGSRTSLAAIRVAENAKVGKPVAAVRFPAVLSGMPRAWNVGGVDFSREAGANVAVQYVLRRGSAVWATITGWPASARSSCPTSGSTREVVNGYQVVVWQYRASGSEPRREELCAARADGLYISVVLSGNHPPVSVASIFGHLQLLGPDQARWTTRPIS